MANALNGNVVAYAPDYSLKHKIGKDISLGDLFTPERLSACEKLIQDSKRAFFETADKELDAVKTLITNYKDSLHDHPDFCHQMWLYAGNIKGAADAFGFSLIARISSHMVDLCDMGKSLSPRTHRLLGKLVDALHLAFDQKIVDDGGAVGRAILADLNAK